MPDHRNRSAYIPALPIIHDALLPKLLSAKTW